MKKPAVATLQGLPRCASRRGGRSGRGGSPGFLGWQRGARWLRRTASATTSSARARAGRKAEERTGSRGREGRCRGRGEVRGVRGRLGNASVEAGGGRGGIGARHRAASVRGEEDDKGEEVSWAGQVGELGRLGWTGKRQVSCWASLLFYISVLFSLFNSFATVLNLK